MSSSVREPPPKKQKISPESQASQAPEIINFQPLANKPSFKFQPSTLASSLPSFLEDFKKKNEALALDAESAKGFEILDGSSEDEDSEGESDEDGDVDEDEDEEEDSQSVNKVPGRKVREIDGDSSRSLEGVPNKESEESTKKDKTKKRKKRKFYIEMELGLGVLEEKAVGSAGEGDQSESSDEESDSGSDSDESSISKDGLGLARKNWAPI